jgi:hypothetical protein
MTCVISDAGTVTLPEYLSSLLVFSDLGFAQSLVSCELKSSGRVTVPASLMTHVMLLLLPNSLKTRSELKYSGRVIVPASLMTHDAGTVTLPEYLSSLLVFSDLGFAQSLVSFVVFCRSLSFCLMFRLTFVLSFELATSDYSFGMC